MKKNINEINILPIFFNFSFADLKLINPNSKYMNPFYTNVIETSIPFSASSNRRRTFLFLYALA